MRSCSSRRFADRGVSATQTAFVEFFHDARGFGRLARLVIALRSAAPPGTPCVNQEANCFIFARRIGNCSAISIRK